MNPRLAAEIVVPCEHVTSHRVDGSSIGCTACLVGRAAAHARAQVAAALERAAKVAKNYNPNTQKDFSGRLLWPPNDDYAGVMRAGAVIAAKHIAAAIRALKLEE